MPRNTFRPFSLKNAFTSDVIVSPTVVDVETSMPPKDNNNNNSVVIMSAGILEEPPMSSLSLSPSSSPMSSCGCKRCRMRTLTHHVVVSNEDLDKKLNWILTLVIFMFIILILHVRSQTTKM